LIEFVPTTQAHDDILRSWILADKLSRISTTAFWMTGASLLSFCCEDAEGAVLFVRIDAEGDAGRLHVLFGPPEEVSKKRIAVSLSKGFPKIADHLRSQGFKAAVYESLSPSLILFMSNLGFVLLSANDYILAL
jgi:hypothetical protein